jgi:hypothetical protein
MSWSAAHQQRNDRQSDDDPQRRRDHRRVRFTGGILFDMLYAPVSEGSWAML